MKALKKWIGQPVILRLAKAVQVRITDFEVDPGGTVWFWGRYMQ